MTIGFESLVQPHRDDIFRYLRWMGCDKSTAEDVLQETLIRAWCGFDHLRDKRATRAWLITIARRERFRQLARKQLPTVSIGPDHETALVNTKSDPSSVMELAQLRQAIAELPMSYQEPLVLQVLMGLSVKEIATQLSLTCSTVMTRVFKRWFPKCTRPLA